MIAKNTYSYRKLLIKAVNLIAIIWLIYETAFREIDDFWWGVLIPCIVALVIYNVYAMLLVRFFFNKNGISPFKKGLYSLLVILPIFVMWYIFH